MCSGRACARIGVGYGALGQVINLPQWGLSCPSRWFRAPMLFVGFGRVPWWGWRLVGSLIWVWFRLGRWEWGRLWRLWACCWWIRSALCPARCVQAGGAVLVLASLRVRRWWCSSVGICVSQWGHLAGGCLRPGVARCGLFLQRYRHGGPHFHSDASAFTGISRFASVITLAKCRFPFEVSASLAKQSERPTGGRDFPMKTRHHLQNSPSVRPGVRHPFENAAPLAKQPHSRPRGGTSL